MTIKSLLPIEQAAEAQKSSLRTVYRLSAADPDYPVLVKVGGRTFVSELALTRFMSKKSLEALERRLGRAAGASGGELL